MNKLISILLFIAGICILALLAILVLHAWLPGFLSGKIEDEIRSGLNPDSIDLYEVEAGTSSFSTFFQTTSITEIRIKPSEIILNEKDAALLPKQIFEAEVYNLKIPSWTLISLALGRNSVEVNRLLTDSIFLAIYANESGKEKADSEQSMDMEHLYLENLNTKKLRFEKRSLADTSRQVLQTGRIGFTGEISFHDKEQDHSQSPGFKTHSLMVLDADGYSSHGLHTFHIDSVFLDGLGQTAELNGLRMIPRYSKQEFHKHVQFETERFDTRLDHIKISGLQPGRIIQDGSIVLSQIEITGGKLEVFRDRNPPFNEKQRPLTPVRLIQEAPFGLFVGEIQLNDFEIVYEEQPEDGDTTGKLPFKQLSATIHNISNLQDSLAADSILNIRAEAFIFGKAMLQAEFKYHLTDPGGTYEAKGELAALNFTEINPAVYPLAGVKVIDGMHQNSSFYFSGNDVSSVGEIRMQYSGLEIELIPDGNKVLNDIANFVGKKVFYHQENPEDNDELRVGKIEFDRDISRFVFNYWWKSYLSGIKDSMLQDHFSW